VIGDIGSPKCVLNKKSVNFRLIPIGIDKTQVIRLKNVGDDNAIFTVSHKPSNELVTNTMNGRIASGDTQQFSIVYKSIQPQAFDVPVTIHIAGALPTLFNVTGQSELPQVQMQNTGFDFGCIFVGSSASLEATICNVGAIPAILFLDLSAHPEFRIEYSADLADKEASEKENSISLVSNTIFITKPTQINEGPSSSGPSLTLNSYPSSDDNSEKDLSGLVYRIYLTENSVVNFSLIFHPSFPGEHSFELPITMMNVISASSFHLQPIISVEAIIAPLSLSDTVFDFGRSPLFDPQNPHSRPVFQQIKLTNETNQNLKWRFDISEMNILNSVFKFEPSSGVLVKGKVASVQIAFTPRFPGPYSMHIPVYTQGDKDESAVGKIHLTGIAVPAPFRVEPMSISLPIVPLHNTAMELNIISVLTKINRFNCSPVTLCAPEAEYYRSFYFYYQTSQIDLVNNSFCCTSQYGDGT
jgi:hypothetical protein